jgi:TonB-dependent starch-binding outer membrane protein SusC
MRGLIIFKMICELCWKAARRYQSYSYRIGVVITLFLFITPGSLLSQSIVHGTIIGVDGETLIGASVSISSTGIGTTTDTLGRFSVKGNRGDHLKFSYIGYFDQEMVLGSEVKLNITLLPSTVNLNELVVLGYGVVKKKDLTGAIAQVNAKDFNQGIMTNPMQQIQGKVSGLQISNDNGQPGGAMTIKLRGNSALSGTGQPLFVLDGVPLDGRSLQAGNNPLNFINPDDIASIDVLKDASATAIYGTRAAYGVIIINTKKGQIGQPQINFSVTTGISSILKRIDVLSPAQYRAALQYYDVNRAFDKGGNTDAMGALLQHGLQKNYTLGISGGNENGKYRISGNVLNQDGIIKKTNFEKYGISFTGNYKFLESKKLALDIQMNSSQYKQDSPWPEAGAAGVIYGALKWNPTDSLINADGSFKRIDGILNPATATEKIKNNLKVTTVLGSISPSYKITDWLEYKLLLSINYSTGIARSSVNQDIIQPGNPPGNATIKNYELQTNLITHTLHVVKDLFPHLHLDAVAGYEFTQFENKGFSLSGNGVTGTGFGNFGLDYTNYVQYSSLTGRSISSFADATSELRSFFGRSIFNFNDKYLLTATFRADGSSKFGANNKYGYFPSFAVAWNISNEKFFKVHFINSFKLRAGWGKTGNQEFPAGSAQAKYSFFDGGIFKQVNNPNPDLKWQSDRQFNAGLDFSILNNRFSGTIDYFNKATTHLLFPSPPIQPAPGEAVQRWINLDGQIRNKGLEAMINGSIIQGKHFGFDLSMNATFLKNNVTGLPAPVFTGFVTGPIQIIQNGYPMNTFFTRKFLGFDKDGFSIHADDGATFYPVGNPNPKTLLGISPSMHYNKLSLTANLYGAFGQDIYFTPLMFALNIGAINVGSNIGTSIYNNPVKESVANPAQSPSSRFIFKGNYMKMSSLTLNYTLGSTNPIFKAANIYLTGQNLFVLTKYPGFSPETNFDSNINGIPSLGIDAPHYPSSRTLIAGLNFSF